MNPPPEPQYNQWSCALACFVWCMKRRGASNLTQDDFVRTNSHLFWEWNEANPERREGLLLRGQLCDLMIRSNYFDRPPRKFVHTDSALDFHDYLNRNYSNGYVGGFVMTRIPTNHCMAIAHWDGEHVTVMDPTGQGSFSTHSWTDLEQNRNADFLAFFQ